MSDEKDLQKRYVQLHLFREQLKAMAEEKSSLEKQISELMISVDALAKLESVSKGEEIWSSIGSGAFVRSSIKETDSVLIGIGAGIVVEKERNQAVEMLKSQLEELVRMDSEMSGELEKYSRQMNMLEEQLRELAEKSGK